MRNVLNRLCLGTLMLVVASAVAGPAQAAPPAPASSSWLEGTSRSQSSQNGVTGGLETSVSSSAAYARDTSLGAGLPAVNEVYWIRVKTDVPGNPLGGGIALATEVVLPPNTQLAVSSTHPIHCWSKYLDEPWEAGTAGSCPGLSAGANGGHRFDPLIASFSHYRTAIPVRSTAALQGSSGPSGGDRIRVYVNSTSHTLDPALALSEQFVSTAGSGGGGGGSTEGAPQNTSAPYTFGNAVAGQTLYCASGEWSGVQYTYFSDPVVERFYTYQNGSPQLLHTGAVLPLTDAHAGRDIYCSVTATNQYGSTTVRTGDVRIAARPQPPKPQNLTPPRTTGYPVVGQTLTCDPGSWAGTGITLAYEWYRVDRVFYELVPGEPASTWGATHIGSQQTLNLTSNLVNAEMVFCEVTATNANGSTSAATGGIETNISWDDQDDEPFGGEPIRASWPTPRNLGAPEVGGTPQDGSPLGCNEGTWDFWTVTRTIQWLRDGQAIPGATGAQYTPSAADVGHAIACEVTGDNPAAGDVKARSGSVTVAARPVETDDGETGGGETGGGTGGGGSTDGGSGGGSGSETTQQVPGTTPNNETQTDPPREEERPQADTSPPSWTPTVARSIRLGRLLRRGLMFRGACSEVCTVEATLELRRRGGAARTVLLSSMTASLAGGEGPVTVKLGSRARRALKRARGKVTLSLATVAIDAAGNRSEPASSAVKLRR